MKRNIFKNVNSIYFIGIGGISMSALAKLMQNFGYRVGGSDLSKSDLTQKLELNFEIFYGHSEQNIKKFKPDLVVYTGAINLNNSEIIFAKNNAMCLERSEFLGEVSKLFKNIIAVAGTHGKTTVTAMIAEIFVNANKSVTAHIGGEVVNLNGNLLINGNKYFITEACEYKKSFLHIKPSLAVVTNIESDHMDCYESFNDLENCFSQFVKEAKAVVTFNNLNIEDINQQTIVCGFKDCNYQAKNIKSFKGCYSFDCYENNVYLAHFRLNVIGKYNIENALLAIAVSRFYDINITTIYNSLLKFNGVKRRNELIFCKEPTCVYADYCHHPTEIKNCINSYKQIYKNVWVVFQPHTYSRTKTLLKEFKNCFSEADKLTVFKTYAARENYDVLGDEQALFNAVKHKNKNVFAEYMTLKNHINHELNNFSCVLVLGAGDLYDLVAKDVCYYKYN